MTVGEIILCVVGIFILIPMLVDIEWRRSDESRMYDSATAMFEVIGILQLTVLLYILASNLF